MTATDETRRPIDLSDLYAALDSASTVMAMSSQDWATAGDFAWLYGIFVGWDDDVIDTLAAGMRWDADQVFRLRRLRAAVARFDLNAVADLADADGLRRRLKRAEYMERMAARHAMERDADVAAAEAKLARRVADVARLESVAAKLRLELRDAREQIGRLQALVDDDDRPGPARIAETLRSAAAGRREDAAALEGTKAADRVEYLELQAHTLDAAACVAEGDLGPLYDWLPSYRWSSEMLAALYGKPAGGKEES